MVLVVGAAGTTHDHPLPRHRTAGAERLRAGLGTRRSGAVTMRRPVALAVPDGDGLDADVRELEKLAVALR